MVVRMHDRWGNSLTTGGAVIGARLSYARQGLHDSNAIKVDNHWASVADQHDGTYIVTYGLQSRGLSGFPLTVQVIVNLDQGVGKDNPNGHDLSPLPCVFHLREQASSHADPVSKIKHSKPADLQRSTTSWHGSLEAPPKPYIKSITSNNLKPTY